MLNILFLFRDRITSVMAEVEVELESDDPSPELEPANACSEPQSENQNLDNPSPELEPENPYSEPRSESRNPENPRPVTNPDNVQSQIDPTWVEEAARSSNKDEASPDNFLNETKYVVLNFMSLLPPELYCQHVSSTPESALSDLSVGNNHNSHYHPLAGHFRSQQQLTKSRSFDISPQRRVPKLKHLSHLKSMSEKELDSPASEDNLSYRYRQYMQSLDQLSIAANSPEVGFPPCDHSDKAKSQSVTSFKTDSPGSVSPRKTPHSLSRWCSDISSSGDFSYASDADDELEDLSNASSIFSLRSACLRDGFLDLRKMSPRLSTVTSQSEEDLDEVDGLFHPMPPLQEEKMKLNDADDIIDDKMETSVQGHLESGNDHSKTPSPRQASLYSKQHSRDSFSGRSHIHSHSFGHENMSLSHNHPLVAGSHDQDELAEDMPLDRQAADRTKLKLDIPSQAVQLDDILLSLQSELNSEITDLESEFEEGKINSRFTVFT